MLWLLSISLLNVAFVRRLAIAMVNRPHYVIALLFIVIRGSGGDVACGPVKTLKDECRDLLAPCNKMQEKREGCNVARREEECLNYTDPLGPCAEDCGRCTPTCSPLDVLWLHDNKISRGSWRDYCRLPECPRASLYYADTICAPANALLGTLQEKPCVNPDGTLPEVATHCPRECFLCDTAVEPTARPTLGPTAPGGPVKRKTKQKSAGNFLYGAIYIEASVGAFLVLVVVILACRRVKKRQKQERRRRANALYRTKS